MSAALCKAITNTLSHHFKGSPFEKKDLQYWEPSLSSQNKYKGGKKENGPKFFGSTTFLAWTTDAWHLFDMLQLTFLQIPFAITAAFLMGSFYWAFAIIAAVKLISGIVFEYFYKRWA